MELESPFFHLPGCRKAECEIITKYIALSNHLQAGVGGAHKEPFQQQPGSVCVFMPVQGERGREVRKKWPLGAMVILSHSGPQLALDSIHLKTEYVL